MGLVQMIVAWAIPDVPRKLSDRIKREDYLTREIIIEQEKQLTNTAGPDSPQLHSDLKNELFLGAADSDSSTELRHRDREGSSEDDVNDYIEKDSQV